MITIVSFVTPMPTPELLAKCMRERRQQSVRQRGGSDGCTRERRLSLWSPSPWSVLYPQLALSARGRGGSRLRDATSVRARGGHPYGPRPHHRPRPAADPKCAMRGGYDECGRERRRRQEASGARGGRRQGDDSGFASGEMEVSSGNPSPPRVAEGESPTLSCENRTGSMGHQMHLFSGLGYPRLPKEVFRCSERCWQ
jgi:hypothetical protein